ncbi:hypothetical protein [Streptomyces sp. GS7]|uniref:hypothetical protein n=1 Tax=Streptomyces sp. GS7 TaxID=2692234 RepID=UPI0013182B44|nr:hypothetical protein [Streptomyces sp. GS7]QHC25164.1 hypothetical protein GR130_31165 [Streptomyces sp. GS7]
MSDESGYDDYEYMPATMCVAAKHETNFAEMDMDTMKDMVKASNPTEVHNVARGWEDVHTQLVGGSGGGIKGAFDAAVNEVLQSWHGAAAEKFKAQAEVISKKIADGATYADYTSRAMKSAATFLEQMKPDIESMEKPSGANSFVKYMEDGGSRDDSGLKRDLADPNVSTQQALDNNQDNLSAGKAQQLRCAVKMENLGAAYVSQAKAMGTWKKNLGHVDDHKDYPGSPAGDPPPEIPMPMPVGSSGTHRVGSPSISGMGQGPGSSPGGIKAPQIPDARTPGISGGMGSVKPNVPDVNTGLDGLHGGGSGGPGVKVPGGGGGGGLGGPGVHVPGGGGGGGGGGLTGIPPLGGNGGGMPSRGGTPGLKTGPGGPGGAKTGPGGTGAKPGTGRAGMPGMGGAHGAGAGKGAGAKGGGGAGGAQARQKGGIIGKSGGKTGGGAQGGSGLHRSRGGAQAGSGTGGRRPAGMAGAHGAHGAKGKDSKGQNGERPDYLVEDEETWTPERNIAPKVIE